LDVLEEYVSSLLRSDQSWSLRAGIKKLVQESTSGKDSLCEILYRALIGDGTIPFSKGSIM
jgi:hypothetical protein